MAAVLALLGAILIGTGSARQHAVAAAADEHAPMDPRLLAHLGRSRAWLLGILIAVAGSVCIAAAIATGRLAVVEPIGTTQVLFALLYTARATRTPLRRRDWTAITCAIVGLAGFLLVADPHEHPDPEPIVPWAVPLGLLAAALVVGVLVARRLDAHRRGIVFAVLAGLGFGHVDALIKLFTTVAGDRGVGEMFGHWGIYAWMALAPVAFLLQQSAYHSTHLGAAMPATSTLAPTTATLLGALMFGEQLRGGAAIPLELAFFALLLYGVAMLARAQPEHLEAELDTAE